MKVVIRNVGGEWQIATVFAGLYNTLVSCGTFAAATRYANENGYEWSRY